MKSNDRPSDEERIDACAAAWLAQRDAGLSPSEADEYAVWLASDARHKAAMSRLEQTWTALHALRNYRPETNQHPDPDLLAPKARSKVRRLPRWVGIAAALVLGFAASLWVGTQREEAPPAGQTYATTEGGYQRITLPDGSSVELNGNSEILVSFQTAERRVELVRGQGYFTVAKDPARPFRVAAAGITVQAVGTAFAVQRKERELEVVVTAGAVQLRRGGQAQDPVVPAAPLGAGWRAVLPVEGSSPPRLEQASTETLRQLLAWQSSRLFFAEMPLGEVVQQFNQRNTVQLEIADPSLASMPIGGSFEAQNVEAFVRLLTSSGEVSAVTHGDGRLELRRPSR